MRPFDETGLVLSSPTGANRLIWTSRNYCNHRMLKWFQRNITAFWTKIEPSPMKPLQNTSCCSDESSDRASSLSLGGDNNTLTAKYLLISIPLFAVWWAIYLNLSTVAALATRHLLSLLKLPGTGHLGSAIRFLTYEEAVTILLKSYRKEIFHPECNPDFTSLHLFAHLDQDVSEVIPYLNAEPGGFQCTHEPPSVTFKPGETD